MTIFLKKTPIFLALALILTALLMGGCLRKSISGAPPVKKPATPTAPAPAPEPAPEPVADPVVEPDPEIIEETYVVDAPEQEETISIVEDELADETVPAPAEETTAPAPDTAETPEPTMGEPAAPEAMPESDPEAMQEAAPETAMGTEAAVPAAEAPAGEAAMPGAEVPAIETATSAATSAADAAGTTAAAGATAAAAEPATEPVAAPADEPMTKPMTEPETPAFIDPENEVVDHEDAPDPLVMGQSYYVQVGAFSHSENADNVMADLTAQGYEGTRIHQTQKGLYCVRVGAYTDMDAANEAKVKLQELFPSSYILKWNPAE